MRERSESLPLADTCSPASSRQEVSDPLPWPASQGTLLCPFCAPKCFCSFTTNICLKREWREEPTPQKASQRSSCSQPPNPKGKSVQVVCLPPPSR